MVKVESVIDNIAKNVGFDRDTNKTSWRLSKYEIRLINNFIEDQKAKIQFLNIELDLQKRLVQGLKDEAIKKEVN